jgi:hypothetical protein
MNILVGTANNRYSNSLHHYRRTWSTYYRNVTGSKFSFYVYLVSPLGYSCFDSEHPLARFKRGCDIFLAISF